jgi:quercetin dioxygenase-like cupin family protein
MKRNARMRHGWLTVLALGVALVGGTVALAAHVPQVDPSTVPPGPGFGSAFLATHNSVDQLRVSPFARAIKRGQADVLVQHVRLGANAATGWHTHPGPAIVTVVDGSLTYEDACGSTPYGPGQGFLDRGFGHVHRAIAGPNGADFYVTYILPSGSAAHVVSANSPTSCRGTEEGDDD